MAYFVDRTGLNEIIGSSICFLLFHSVSHSVSHSSFLCLNLCHSLCFSPGPPELRDLYRRSQAAFGRPQIQHHSGSAGRQEEPTNR